MYVPPYPVSAPAPAANWRCTGPTQPAIVNGLAMAGANSTGPGVKYYVLHSLLPAALRHELIDPVAEEAPRALCMTVLALIRLAGGSLHEGELRLSMTFHASCTT